MIEADDNRTTIRNFYGTQQEHELKNPFVLYADEPAVFWGKTAPPIRWSTFWTLWPLRHLLDCLFMPAPRVL